MGDEIPSWASEVATAILSTVKIKDPYTFYHCCRVGRAARRLAAISGLGPFEQAVLEYSGLFHDVGKVGIHEGILLKPARLDEAEIAAMKTHPEKSVAVIEPFSHVPFFRFLIPGVKFHHERMDGKGYPYGLKGEQIPLAARLVAVVDMVDAMSNTRPYRKALPWETVVKELELHAGTQFDANLVKLYLDHHNSPANLDSEGEDEVVIPRLLKAA